MSSNNQTILVIGGAGYIGSHVVLELCEQDYDVTVFDNLSTGYEINVDSRAEMVQGDILNIDELKNLFTRPYDVVFHFAALKSTGVSMQEPEKYATTNITGTINILNQMASRGVKNIIFSSTAAVYGMPKYLPIDESHPLVPVNFYGFSKLEIERILFWFKELKEINFAALRFFNVAGYDPDGRITELERNPANLLPIIMETAVGIRESMQVFGNDYDTADGTCIRDYIHVSDLASAHLKAMDYIIKKKEALTLNLATGKGYSVLDVITQVKEVTKIDIPYNIVSRRLGDPAELVAMSELAQRTINWECQYSDINTILESMWMIYNQK